MKDYLLDIVRNSHDLGCFSAVKVTGTDRGTVFDAISQDLTVIMAANTHVPVPDFQGVFGMPNLDKLKLLLNLQEYRENAQITISRQDRHGNGVMEPTGLHFANSSGDFQNDYRFMTADIVAEKLKTAKPKKQPTWIIEFEPTLSSIQRLKMQAQVHSDERLFKVSIDRDLLKMSFGDHSSHAGEFVFHSGIQSQLTKPWSWPSQIVISILDLAGDKRMRISDEGVTEITVDSGLVAYRYSLMAQTK